MAVLEEQVSEMCVRHYSDQGLKIRQIETGILYEMRKNNPDKEFITVPSGESCNCADCSHMKLNTLEKLYLCLFLVFFISPDWSTISPPHFMDIVPSRSFI